MGVDGEVVVTYKRHTSHLLSDGLGGVERADIVLPSMQEIVGKPSVERFCGVGGEGKPNVAFAGADVFRTAGKDGVEPLTVVGGDVLDVRDVFETALNLERADAGVEHLLEMVAAVHVAQREQVTIADERVAVGILKGEGQAAELGTLAAVGRAAEAVLRGVALAAVADAEGTVDKSLEWHVGHGGMDVGHLLKAQFAGQHRLAEAQLLQQLNLLRRTVVHLCGGMEGNRGEVHAEQGGVLHDEGIDAEAVEVPDEPFDGGELVIIEDGVDGDVDTDVERMGIFHQLADVVERIACRGTGTEARSTDIDGISTMVNSSDTADQVPCRRK